MNLFIAIFLGGGFGALSRYLIIDQINKLNNPIIKRGMYIFAVNFLIIKKNKGKSK